MTSLANAIMPGAPEPTFQPQPPSTPRDAAVKPNDTTTYAANNDDIQRADNQQPVQPSTDAVRESDEAPQTGENFKEVLGKRISNESDERPGVKDEKKNQEKQTETDPDQPQTDAQDQQPELAIADLGTTKPKVVAKLAKTQTDATAKIAANTQTQAKTAKTETSNARNNPQVLPEQASDTAKQVQTDLVTGSGQPGSKAQGGESENMPENAQGTGSDTPASKAKGLGSEQAKAQADKNNASPKVSDADIKIAVNQPTQKDQTTKTIDSNKLTPKTQAKDNTSTQTPDTMDKDNLADTKTPVALKEGADIAAKTQSGANKEVLDQQKADVNADIKVEQSNENTETAKVIQTTDTSDSNINDTGKNESGMFETKRQAALQNSDIEASQFKANTETVLTNIAADESVSTGVTARARMQNAQPIVEITKPSSANAVGGLDAGNRTKSAFVDPATQIIDRININQTGSTKEIRLVLNPEELGRVVIRFQQNAGEITGVLEVDKASTRYDIEKALPQILASLQDNGVSIKRIEVVLNDQSNSNQQQDQLSGDAEGMGQGDFTSLASDSQTSSSDSDASFSSAEEYAQASETLNQAADDSLNMYA